MAPSEAAQTSQGSSHAASQQTPSDKNPLAHVLAELAACPFFNPHPPVAPHVIAPVHPPPTSSALVIGVQVPAGAHVLHGPAHAELQQTPPSVALAQMQTPWSLHVWAPLQPLTGSCAFLTGTQFPVAHDSHCALHALAQQTPATQ
jgi:hypothetical protein